MDEVILKEHHDDNLVFFKDEKIPFTHCTPDRKMTVSELFRFTSDSAGEDFSLRNMSWQFLYDKGLAIILSRASYHINKMPVADQIITLKTWESAAQGPLCTRNYEIYAYGTDELLVKGQTLWTILDLKNKRLMPAKAYPYRPLPTVVTDFDGIKCGKISMPENMEVLGTKSILYSDLDANGHSNNSKYINFVLDLLPNEYQTKNFTDVRLNYSKETKLGDQLEIKVAYEENKIIAQGIVDGTSSFEAELYY